MTNKVLGYMGLNDMTDRFGNYYELGTQYEIGDSTKLRHNGFHFCKNIADVLRYCDGFNDNVNICLVEGSGALNKYDDEIYEYFDMYISSKVKILKVLSREEIFQDALNSSFTSVLRFISGYKLNEEEMSDILDRYNEHTVEDYINYYQRKDEEVFKRRIRRLNG